MIKFRYKRKEPKEAKSSNAAPHKNVAPVEVDQENAANSAAVIVAATLKNGHQAELEGCIRAVVVSLVVYFGN